ncbi:MAG: TPM domain-containing protein [Ignavibacteriae bacterium]|nr:TPM domain-containing protein [Ignavibacteriota bacterium]
MASKTKHIMLACLVGMFLFSLGYAQEAKIPKLFKRITDFTNTLAASEIDALEADLARFEDSTSTQILVVMIPTVGGEAIEEFALHTAESNQIGQKERDNGALLLIAKDDRKMRIEVGYGLEGVVTDALSGQIIRREIAPAFKAGNYYEGIRAGVEAIMLASRNEYKAEKAKRKDDSFGGFGFIIFLVILFFIMARAGRRNSMMRSMGLPLILGSTLGRHHRGGGSWGGFGGGGGGGFGGFSGGGGSFGGGGSSGGW